MGDGTDLAAQMSAEGRGSETTNLLLLASAETAAGQRACFDLLSAQPGGRSAVVVVSPDLGPDAWLDRWDAGAGDRAADIGFVDVGGETRGAAAAASAVPTDRREVVLRTVEQPGNLTDIGVAVSNLFSELGGTGDGVAVCLRSLGSLLEAAGPESVFRFLHTLTGMAQTAGHTCHVHLDPTRVDQETLYPIMVLFDVVAEHEDDGGWTVSGHRFPRRGD